ncbi:hypothetical protein [Streptomyces sp. WAC06614]|uniref:hypothetical protein n=1 Tax=Streptomyces sp. WAC06614 TaxID=2487416 RepID=UPI000F76C89F|nr:hypothetical protein [Streptomyces sp. WAC06614]RSS70745.1 hypothetical protein EF918_27060 [Streptomyces sp. WAC06614]
MGGAGADGTGKAVEALGRVADLERAARRGSGWYATYLTVFAAGQLVLVPMALLWHGLAAATTFAVLQVVLVGGMSAYAAKQRVMRRGFGMRHGLIIGVWGLLFALTVLLGLHAFADQVGFAVVAALVCAAPPALGALAERRRSA